jgi:predicted amidophosphoribosyltransferase
MRSFKQTVCRNCGEPMETVATIAPMCGSPGLVAFLCSACGGTKSDLVPPEHWQVEASPGPGMAFQSPALHSMTLEYGAVH